MQYTSVVPAQNVNQREASVLGSAAAKYAASEDRTRDLGIMRPTRYQLRYSRQCMLRAGTNQQPQTHMWD